MGQKSNIPNMASAKHGVGNAKQRVLVEVVSDLM